MANQNKIILFNYAQIYISIFPIKISHKFKQPYKSNKFKKNILSSFMRTVYPKTQTLIKISAVSRI